MAEILYYIPEGFKVYLAVRNTRVGSSVLDFGF